MEGIVWRMAVQDWPQEKGTGVYLGNNLKQKLLKGVAQVVECFSTKHKALSSSPNTGEKKKKRKKEKEKEEKPTRNKQIQANPNATYGLWRIMVCHCKFKFHQFWQMYHGGGGFYRGNLCI
jgi:hypothetical protein